MTDEYIAKEDLEAQKIYIVDARNFGIAMWTVGEEFEGIRHKFGFKFLDTEYHWDNGAPHGTVKPIREATEQEIKDWLVLVNELDEVKN